MTIPMQTNDYQPIQDLFIVRFLSMTSISPFNRLFRDISEAVRTRSKISFRSEVSKTISNSVP